jgi:hypothetical protein
MSTNKEIEELLKELKDWQKCAEDLVDYAHEFVHQTSLWQGYDRYDRQIKTAEDAIEAYVKLKNKSNQNT